MNITKSVLILKPLQNTCISLMQSHKATRYLNTTDYPGKGDDADGQRAFDFGATI